MSAAVKDLTATELAGWFAEKLPCARGGMVCPRLGVWRAEMDCGHWAVLCEEHHAEAVRKLSVRPGYWDCFWCKARTNNLKWRRL